MGNNDQNPGFRGRHTPEFAQQAMRALRLFQRMTDDDPVKQRIGKRQPLVLDQRGEAFALRRPALGPCASGAAEITRRAPAR